MEYKEYIGQFKYLGYEDDDIFYPDEDPIYGKVFKSFFTFCKDNIDHKMWRVLNIKPCYFFFDKSDKCNAVAEQHLTEENVIAINKGLVKAFNDIFTDLNSYTESLPETKLLREADLDTPAYYLMFQACTMFVYYHELGHIIQFSGAYKKKFQERRINNDDNEKEFDIIDHAVEFDSDEMAANFTFEHIIKYWRKIPVERRSTASLEAFLTINIVALFILFDLLAEGITLPLYYDKLDHPHDVIRIISVVIIFLEKSSSYIDTEASKDKILKRSFEILQSILSGNQSIDKFFAAINSDKHKIAEYSSEILRTRKKYSWMVINQMDAVIKGSQN